MLLDFGVMSVDDLKSGRMAGASHPDLSYPLYDFLKSLVPLQAFAVLIIDEARISRRRCSKKFASCPIWSRRKTAAGRPHRPARAAGQAEAAGNAAARPARVRAMQPGAAQPGRGCGIHHASPRAWPAEPMTACISHRMPIDAVFRVSGGTPRVINLICDRALHRGHLTHKSAIDLEAVTQAIDDLGVGALTAAPRPSRRRDAAPPSACHASAAPASYDRGASDVDRLSGAAPSLQWRQPHRRAESPRRAAPSAAGE